MTISLTKEKPPKIFYLLSFVYRGGQQLTRTKIFQRLVLSIKYLSICVRKLVSKASESYYMLIDTWSSMNARNHLPTTRLQVGNVISWKFDLKHNRIFSWTPPNTRLGAGRKPAWLLLEDMMAFRTNYLAETRIKLYFWCDPIEVQRFGMH